MAKCEFSKFFVSLPLCNVFSCVPFHVEYLHLDFITTDLDSSVNVLRFAIFNKGSALVCFVNIRLLAFIGLIAVFVFELSVLNVLLAGGLVSWLYCCPDLELYAGSLAQFLGSSVSKGDEISHCS